MNRVLSIGASYFQVDCEKFPLENGLEVNKEYVGRDYQISAGGSALNFAQVCGKLGMESLFLGKIGEDEVGKTLVEIVKKSGVAPEFIIAPFVKTNLGLNYIDEEGNSVMTVVGSANQSLNIDEILEKLDALEGEFEFLYLGGCFKLKSLIPDYSKLVDFAKLKKIKVVLDHGRITNIVTQEEKEFIRELVKNVDYYMPSENEFLEVWETQSIEEGIKKINSESLTVVIKQGEKGARAFNKGNQTKVEAYKVEVLNTVGAGDSFNAGFIKGQSDGKSLEDSLKTGVGVAALKISLLKLATENDVKVFLEENP